LLMRQRERQSSTGRGFLLTSDSDSVLLVKDSKEINAVRSACSVADVVFKKFMLPKLEEVVDKGKKVEPVKVSMPFCVFSSIGLVFFSSLLKSNC
jgi:hypothetical protein